MGQIGGSQKVRDDLAHALEIGRKVTAKVQWISKPANDTRSRWIHCTPLLGVNSLIAVWMVILVNDADDGQKRPSQAPPGPSIVDYADSTTAAILPWTSIENSGTSGVVRDGLGTDIINRSGSQGSFDGQNDNRTGRRPPRNLVPVAPERNRLRKEREGPERFPSGSSQSHGASAITAPFASKTDSRYNVSIWSESQEPKASASKERLLKQGKPLLGEPSDIAGSNLAPFAVRPGPRINGKAYSLNSASERGISANDDATHGNDDERPSSQSSSLAPMRGTGPPIHLPFSEHSREDDRPPTRKTYKSLSPYGVLFND